LIEEWNLSSTEVDYTNAQQGLCCVKCYSNLRSVTLAQLILNKFSLKGNLMQNLSSGLKKIKILEINEAGDLHLYLSKTKNYVFAKYPEIDMQNMAYADNSFNAIVHSDTLEHIENTMKALKECYRILKFGGYLFYTIPIIYGRLTIRRDKLPNSYHGSQEESQGNDYKVWTEYGADFWVELVNAGFDEITLLTISDLSSVAICARKNDKGLYGKKKKSIIERIIHK
jgi:SAM-dependent methyltransferase